MESNLKPLESKSALTGIKNYFSLVKFAHTIFAMPFALIGFFYGLKTINFQLNRPWWLLFILVVLCMVFARSAAMGFNRWLDAEYDAKNPRTVIREIPGGIIVTPKDLLHFAI
jgi:4-hydroxybenzoate polyprenyltransferase